MNPNQQKKCLTCTFVGKTIISQINLPPEPDTFKQAQPAGAPGPSGGLSSSNRKRKSYQTGGPVNKKSTPIARKRQPKYFFSKNNWTDDKEAALEKLLEL